MIRQSKKMAHSLAHRALRLPVFGGPFCAFTAAVGWDKLTRRASRHTGYMPATVLFDVKGSGGRATHGSLSSAGGRDQIARAIWLRGLEAYEAPLPQLFMQLMQGAQSVFDIGANSGLYAILAALTEPRCHVIAFEPFPAALASLRQNLAANGLANRVTVVEAAAGDSNGEANLFIPEKKFGDVLETSASLVREFRPRHSEILKTRVVQLDDYVKRNNVPGVSVIRADVEGAEHLVLQGATEILQTHRPFVFVEILAEISATYLERSRLKAGYRAMCVGPGTLTAQQNVTCVPGSYNHLWYPPEKHEKVLEAADACGLRVVGDD